MVNADIDNTAAMEYQYAMHITPHNIRICHNPVSIPCWGAPLQVLILLDRLALCCESWLDIVVNGMQHGIPDRISKMASGQWSESIIIKKLTNRENIN